MKKKTLILGVIGIIAFLYSLIVMQIVMGFIWLLILGTAMYVIEKVLPAIDTYMKNIQQIADDLHELRNSK